MTILSFKKLPNKNDNIEINEQPDYLTAVIADSSDQPISAALE